MAGLGLSEICSLLWRLVLNSAWARLWLTRLSALSILPPQRGSSFQVSFVGLSKITAEAASDNEREGSFWESGRITGINFSNLFCYRILKISASGKSVDNPFLLVAFGVWPDSGRHSVRLRWVCLALVTPPLLLTVADYSHLPVDMYKQTPRLFGTRLPSAHREEAQGGEGRWGDDASLPSCSRQWKSEAGLGTSWYMLIVAVVWTSKRGDTRSKDVRREKKRKRKE